MSRKEKRILKYLYKNNHEITRKITKENIEQILSMSWIEFEKSISNLEKKQLITKPYSASDEYIYFFNSRLTKEGILHIEGRKKRAMLNLQFTIGILSAVAVIVFGILGIIQ